MKAEKAARIIRFLLVETYAVMLFWVKIILIVRMKYKTLENIRLNTKSQGYRRSHLGKKIKEGT